MIKRIDIGPYTIDGIPGSGLCIIDSEVDFLAASYMSDRFYELIGLSEYPFHANTRIWTDKFILELNTSDGKIIGESLCDSRGNTLASIILGTGVTVQERAIWEDSLNFDGILEIPSPETPWMKSLFLEKVVDLGCSGFRVDTKVPLSKRRKVRSIMASLGFAKYIDENWMFSCGQGTEKLPLSLQGSGAEYAARLLSWFTDSIDKKETLVMCDPYLKVLHNLVEEKLFFELGTVIRNRQLLIFGGPDTKFPMKKVMIRNLNS